MYFCLAIHVQSIAFKKQSGVNKFSKNGTLFVMQIHSVMFLSMKFLAFLCVFDLPLFCYMSKVLQIFLKQSSVNKFSKNRTLFGAVCAFFCSRRRRRRLTRAEINTEPSSKSPPETDRCHKASPVDLAAVGGRSGSDHLLAPAGRMIFRLEEECIPMLDAVAPPPPHLILDTTGSRRTSGHVCPACLEAKAAAAAAQAGVEPQYVRAPNGGGTPAPTVLLGCADGPAVGAELADRTMGRHRSRVMGGCPSVPQ